MGQGDSNKCHLNSNSKPSRDETCHRKAAQFTSVTMLSGPVVIVSRAAARATAVIVIWPTAAVVDTNFFVYLRARQYLKRTVRKAKRDWAMDFTTKVEPKNIWKLTSWYKGIR